MKFAGAFRADFAAPQSTMVKLTKNGDGCISIPAGSTISSSFRKVFNKENSNIFGSAGMYEKPLTVAETVSE